MDWISWVFFALSVFGGQMLLLLGRYMIHSNSEITIESFAVALLLSTALVEILSYIQNN